MAKANNFTDRNKHSDHDKPQSGFDMVSFSKENGYGRPQLDAPMSRPGPAYVNGPNQSPINLSGKENFTEERFSGDMGGQARVQASSDSRDGIETMGGAGDEQNKRSF